MFGVLPLMTSVKVHLLFCENNNRTFSAQMGHAWCILSNSRHASSILGSLQDCGGGGSGLLTLLVLFNSLKWFQEQIQLSFCVSVFGPQVNPGERRSSFSVPRLGTKFGWCSPFQVSMWPSRLAAGGRNKHNTC